MKTTLINMAHQIECHTSQMFSLATHTQRPSKTWTLQRIRIAKRSRGCTVRQREAAESLIWSPPSKENGQAYVKLLKLIGCKNLQGQVTHLIALIIEYCLTTDLRRMLSIYAQNVIWHLHVHVATCSNTPYPFWKPQPRASSFEWWLLRPQYLQLLQYTATVCKVYTQFLARMQHIYILRINLLKSNSLGWETKSIDDAIN